MKHLFIIAALALIQLTALAAGEYTTENVNKIKIGMTEQEVIEILGEPQYKALVTGGDMGWNFNKVSFGRISSAVIFFKDGKVNRIPGEILKDKTVKEADQFLCDRYLENHPDLPAGLKRKLESGQHKLAEIEEEHKNWKKFEADGKKLVELEGRDIVGLKGDDLAAYVRTNSIDPQLRKDYMEGKIDLLSLMGEQAAINSKRIAALSKKLKAGWAQKAYLERHPNLPAPIRSAMTNGTPAIGMDKEQAELALGKPDKVNTTVTASGVTELWNYGISLSVNFSDGKVTSWTTSK